VGVGAKRQRALVFFENTSLSLIVDGLAEYIYLVFMQNGAKLTEIFQIL
jgi:hypothetical protein